MALRILTAPPGGGKTVNVSRAGIKLFKEENSFFKRHKKDYIYYLNIYSNYPVLLWYQKEKFLIRFPDDSIHVSVPVKLFYDDQLEESYYIKCKEEEREYYGVFSLKCKFIDMVIAWNFGKKVNFLIDEVQFMYDSQEYKDFPDCIAHFFQVHRHLNINMIYTNSQSLSRVIKRLLTISEEFWNVIEFKPKLFLLPFLAKVKFKVTYDIESSKSTENDKTLKENVEYKTVYFFNKRVYNSYISKYLGKLLEDLPYYKMETYDSLLMNKKDIMKSFNITKEEKEKLLKMEF